MIILIIIFVLIVGLYLFNINSKASDKDNESLGGLNASEKYSSVTRIILENNLYFKLNHSVDVNNKSWKLVQDSQNSIGNVIEFVYGYGNLTMIFQYNSYINGKLLVLTGSIMKINENPELSKLIAHEISDEWVQKILAFNNTQIWKS